MADLDIRNMPGIKHREIKPCVKCEIPICEIDGIEAPHGDKITMERDGNEGQPTEERGRE